MKRFVIHLVFLCVFFAQKDTIHTYLVIDSTVQDFDRDLIGYILDLYQKHTEDEKIFKFYNPKTFNESFTKLDDPKIKHNSLSINELTITKKRLEKYDFSYPYFPISQAIITYKTSKIDSLSLDDLDGFRLAVPKSTLHEELSIQLRDQYNVKRVLVNEMQRYSDLYVQGKIDGFMSDAIVAWKNRKKYKVLMYLDEFSVDNFGILFPKGSRLKQELDPIIKYFVRSKTFYALIEKHFGVETLVYFKKIKALRK